MRITNVQFPTAITVAGQEPRSSWQPGERGVVSVTAEESGRLLFAFMGGKYVYVYPPAGTRVDLEADEPPRSTASDSTAPAKPVRKGR